MIDEISEMLTGIIKKNSGPMDPEREEIINYGINLLVYQVLLTSIVILLSILAGVFLSAVVLLVVNGVLRRFAGGAHARTRPTCAASFFIMAAGIIILSKFLWNGSFYPSLPLLAIEIAMLFIYAPGDTVEKPIASRRIRKRMKILSVISTVVIFVAAVLVWRCNKEMYSMILLSTIPSMFLLTPAGYRIFGCRHSHYDIHISSASTSNQ